MDMNFGYTPAVSDIRELNAYEIDDISGGFWPAVIAVGGAIVGATGGAIAGYDRATADGQFSGFRDYATVGAGAVLGGIGGAGGAIRGSAGILKAWRYLHT